MSTRQAGGNGEDGLRMLERYRDAYALEASELLGELERSLLDLEQNPGDAELVGRVFRSLHTIKGSGAMVGFDAIASFTHELETVFDDVRAGRTAITPELIGVTLDARDHIQNLLRGPAENGVDPAAAGDHILKRLQRAAAVTGEGASPQKSPGPDPCEASETQVEAPIDYRIHFEPNEDILLDGTNPILLLRELSALGECSLLAHLDAIPDLEALNPEACYTRWDAVLTTTAGENAIRDVFVFVEDRANLQVTRIAETGSERPRLGEILADRGDVDPRAVEDCLTRRPLTGELLVEAGLVSKQHVNAAVLEQRHLDTTRDNRRPVDAATSLRVPAAKLDSMVDIVGELVMVQARLSGYAQARGESDITFIAEEVERLTELLRETTMSLRMLPIGETFRRFKRLVRDLSAGLEKKAELTTDGNETELDKTVIEQLGDPLVHLIRNALDHGIEPPEERLRLGKPATGKVHLSACHSGGFVLIRVEDDGAGMNRDAIRARAVERGLIRPDAVLTDEEIFALTLAPGFSTASQVTEVSGRGVGMDIVQRSIDGLRGTLSISSQPGKGTVVTLKIPLTLAIIDGLLVKAGGTSFVVPLSNISECIELERDAKARSGKQSLVSVRGELVPYVTLRERFALPGEAPPIEHVIVAETRDGKFGLVVDHVVGDHQTVIKKLGSLYRHVAEVSGATVLGDGTVALVLDVDNIALEAIREKSRA